MHRDIEDFRMPEDEDIEAAADAFRILSDPTRLRMLLALSQGESSVACLAELAGAHSTAVSQHLSKLRLAGMVKARRQGTYMFYTVVDPALLEILDVSFWQQSKERDDSTRAVSA